MLLFLGGNIFARLFYFLLHWSARGEITHAHARLLLKSLGKLARDCKFINHLCLCFTKKIPHNGDSRVFFPLLVQSGRRRGPSVNARAYSQYALACKCRSPVDEHTIECDRGFLPNHKSCFSVFVLRAKNNYTFIIWLEIEILYENCVAENGKESRGGNLSFAKTSKYFLQRRVNRHNIYCRQ